MTKRLRLTAVVGAIFALIMTPFAYGAGLWWGLPLFGTAAYCTGYSQYPTAATVPGTQAGGAVCNSTAPAGPALFSGTETFPTDLFGAAAPSAQTNTAPSVVNMPLVTLGQGPYTINNAPGTAIAIANNTPWYITQGGQGSAWTITMPTAPIEGQIQHVVCGATTAGTLTIAAAAGQTLVGNPAAVCTVGNGYSFRYVASSTTWYRFS